MIIHHFTDDVFLVEFEFAMNQTSSKGKKNVYSFYMSLQPRVISFLRVFPRAVRRLSIDRSSTFISDVNRQHQNERVERERGATEPVHVWFVCVRGAFSAASFAGMNRFFRSLSPKSCEGHK